MSLSYDDKVRRFMCLFLVVWIPFHYVSTSAILKEFKNRTIQFWSLDKVLLLTFNHNAATLKGKLVKSETKRTEKRLFSMGNKREMNVF